MTTPAISEIAVSNSFEHFDECLFIWYNSSPDYFIDRCIYGQGGIVFQDMDEQEIDVEPMRGFDRRTGIVSFRREQFDSKAVVEKVQGILENIKQKARY